MNICLLKSPKVCYVVCKYQSCSSMFISFSYSKPILLSLCIFPFQVRSILVTNVSEILFYLKLGF